MAIGKSEARRRELFQVQNVHQKALRDERTATGLRVSPYLCHRYAIGAREHVEVRGVEGRAYFSGAIKCGSAWACPTCADQIMRAWQEDLRKLSSYHGTRWLVTLTAAHAQSDALATTLHGMTDAMANLADRRSFQRFRKESDGYVRSTEITRTRSAGWHPHFHLLFLGAQPDFENDWIRSLEKYGLSGKAGVAFDCREVYDDVSDYLAKTDNGGKRNWDSAKEMAARPGSKKSASIFDMKGGDLIREHYWATRGKSRMRWSKGLKAAFGIEEISEEQIVMQERPESELIMYVKRHEFAALAVAGVRAEFLEAVERDGWKGGTEFLKGLSL